MHQLSGKSVIVLGAGPTGLGAAHRLAEIGDVNIRVYDRNPYPGGLSASFVDSHGFTWDIGGHVQFSHYAYFDRLMDDLLGEEWLAHERESWVWMRERFIPYPLQNNIHLLPRNEFDKCLAGILQTLRGPRQGGVNNFKDWIQESFGSGLAEVFMQPYNFKVWAHEPGTMNAQWVGERVATVDVMRIISNALDGSEDRGWGPNNRFRFPLRGGTGRIWSSLANRLSEGVFRPNRNCAAISTKKQTVRFEDGSVESYDQLISTIPLDRLIEISDLDELKPAVREFRYSTVHVVGVGLRGAPPAHLRKKCWMYFPENNCPFYRATVFSNYSPNNVPDAANYWSLMTEVSESPYKPVDRSQLVDSVLDGMIATRLIESRSSVVSVWVHTAGHGYPTPFLGRDRLVEPIISELEKSGVFSRGRFGGWKYEVSNQDHSMMQGVELANRLAFGTPEITYWHPNVANKVRP